MGDRLTSPQQTPLALTTPPGQQLPFTSSRPEQLGLISQ